jgi:peptide/nickel transport system ATP-binding protein
VTAPDRPLLRVDGLRTVFPRADGRDAAAVADVSLTMARGEALGLVGESGSGKSMTALSIIRAVPPPGRIAAGRIELDGRNLLELDEAAMRRVRGRRIGFVFQEPALALDPVFTIGYQIGETLAAHDLARGAAARARAADLLAAVGVPDAAGCAGRYPHELSGGLRQRALIAIALAAEPDLLIADEPTTALDAARQAEILDLLATLRRTLRLSLLLITHDLGVVAQLADRVAVLYAGRIVEQAATPQLFHAPAHPYTRALLAAIPGASPGRRLRAIPGAVPPLGLAPPGCAFAARCGDRFAPCDHQLPGWSDVAPGHDVRCHLHDRAARRTEEHGA